MGIRSWLANRDEQTDTTWTANLQADATFERWLMQTGTDFLPPDTGGWPVAEVSPELRAHFSGGDLGGFAAMYRTQPAVYTCVEFLAWQMSQLSLKVYDRVDDDDRQAVHDNVVARTIRKPAPGMTYARMMHATVADLCVYGNAYWILLEAPTSVTERGFLIVPVCAEYVQPRGGNVLEAAEYEVFYGAGTPADKRVYPASQVCHFRRYNPIDRRIGVSPLVPLRGVLREEYESQRYREVSYKKDLRMGGFIRRAVERAGTPMDPDARERFRSGLDKFTKGGRNEGSWMLLEEAEQPVPISFSPRDAEYIAGRKLALEVVARAYNIPLPVLSITESVAYSSQREHHKALYQDTLPPYTRNIEDEVMEKLVPWLTSDPDIYVEFNLEEKMRGAFDDQADLLYKAAGGPYMTRAEVRARLNLPKKDDPRLDEMVITNNMQGTESEDGTTNPAEEPREQPAAAAAPVVQLAPSQEGTAP